MYPDPPPISASSSPPLLPLAPSGSSTMVMMEFVVLRGSVPEAMLGPEQLAFLGINPDSLRAPHRVDSGTVSPA